MRNVVLVSYHFPPQGGKAVQRASKLAKYLPDYGWRPIVFAMPEGGGRVPMDPSLCAELPAEVEVHRPGFFDPRRLLPGEIRKLLPRPLPDRYRTWAEKSAPKLSGLIAGAGAEAMISTSPSHSAQLLGLLAARATGIPWISDFRDPWSGHSSFGGRPGDEEMLRLETEVITESHAVVGVYPAILRDFRDRVDPERLHLIENGYDEDDFDAVDWEAPPADGGVLTLGHNGTVSGFHDPVPVLKALRLMLRQGLEPGSVRAVFTTSEYGRKRFSGFGDLMESGMLEVRGYRPHRRSIADLARLDVSLLLLTRGDGIYPGKVFEYMRLGNPILSVSGTGDDLHRLLEETGTGTVAERSDPAAIAGAIGELLERKRAGTLPHLEPDPGSIRRFSRREIARRYAGLLDSAASS